MEKEEGRGFLTSLLNKNLRILVTDGRMFLGQFKCTDPVSNPAVQCKNALLTIEPVTGPKCRSSTRLRVPSAVRATAS